MHGGDESQYSNDNQQKALDWLAKKRGRAHPADVPAIDFAINAVKHWASKPGYVGVGTGVEKKL